MKRVFIIAREYLRIGVLGEMAYRANFFVQLFESAVSLVVALGGVAIVFQHTERLGEWLPDQMVVLVGIFLLIGGIINFVISPGMEQLMSDVREGTLDFALTKPADAQLLVTVRRFQIWKLVDVALGLLVMGVGLFRLRSEIGVGETAVFIFALICGTIIIYCFFILLATLSFWFIKVENILNIFQSTYSAARWPVSIYPLWLRFGLTFIIPIAFAVTVPVQGLIGQLDRELLFTMIFVTVGIGVSSRLFWRRGLRHYSGASA